jgi:hypothetical protein
MALPEAAAHSVITGSPAAGREVQAVVVRRIWLSIAPHESADPQMQVNLRVPGDLQ